MIEERTLHLAIVSLGLLFLTILSITLKHLVGAGLPIPTWATSLVTTGQWVGIGVVVLLIVRLALKRR